MFNEIRTESNNIDIKQRRDIRVQSYVNQEVYDKVIGYFKENNCTSTSAAVGAIITEYFKNKEIK